MLDLLKIFYPLRYLVFSEHKEGSSYKSPDIWAVSSLENLWISTAGSRCFLLVKSVSMAQNITYLLVVLATFSLCSKEVEANTYLCFAVPGLHMFPSTSTLDPHSMLENLDSAFVLRGGVVRQDLYSLELLIIVP